MDDGQKYVSIRIWSDTMRDLEEIARFLYEHHKIAPPTRVGALAYVVRRYRELNVDKGK
jgi:hypothetical protein